MSFLFQVSFLHFLLMHFLNCLPSKCCKFFQEPNSVQNNYIFKKLIFRRCYAHILFFLCNIHNASTTSNPKKVQIREFNQNFLFSIVDRKTENDFVFENRKIIIYFEFLMDMFCFPRDLHSTSTIS